MAKPACSQSSLPSQLAVTGGGARASRQEAYDDQPRDEGKGLSRWRQLVRESQELSRPRRPLPPPRRHRWPRSRRNSRPRRQDRFRQGSRTGTPTGSVTERAERSARYLLRESVADRVLLSDSVASTTIMRLPSGSLCNLPTPRPFSPSKMRRPSLITILPPPREVPIG